jgi:hypothetical protein
MTLAQMELLENNLAKFIKWDNGKDDGAEDKLTDADMNTRALEGTVKMLSEKTGRKTFNYAEIMDPAKTLELHNKRIKNG